MLMFDADMFSVSCHPFRESLRAKLQQTDGLQKWLLWVFLFCRSIFDEGERSKAYSPFLSNSYSKACELN